MTDVLSIPPENHAILSPQIPRSPGDKQLRVLWLLVTTKIKSSDLLFPFLIKVSRFFIMFWREITFIFFP